MIYRILRDPLRSALLVLLIACAVVVCTLGATVHVFTLQQTGAVDDSTFTLAVRHVGSQSTSIYDVRQDAKMLKILNAHESVKVPALIRPFAAIDASVVPVYSGDAGVYVWSHDREIARTVITATCTEFLGYSDVSSSEWNCLVEVDEVHLPLPYEIPDKIRISGTNRGSQGHEPLISGKQYLLCGLYTDYPMELDMSASLVTGFYDPVYVQDKSEPPCLYLRYWWDRNGYMKYIASPDDTQWLEAAVRMGDINNRMLRLSCINDLNRLRWFQNGTATIIEGRSFTQAEQETGAKVCIISKELADANALKVGDYITMNANQASIGLSIWDGRETDLLNEYYDFTNVIDLPDDDYYDYRGVDVTLEVVGIYSAPLYKNTIDEFTPNTIFAPYEAVEFTFHDLLLWRLPIHTQNIILHNGQGEAFLQAVRDAGYPDGLYTIEETNYDAVKEVLANMSADSQMLLAISACVGVLMLIVVLALYARGWRKENAILAMLGTTKMRIANRMFTSLAVLTLLGCAAAFGGMCAAKSYIEDALNSVYIGESASFSAIRVGAFSEKGITIGVETIAMALGMTAAVFLLIAAMQSIVSAGKKVRECLHD